eukprot:1139670_1
MKDKDKILINLHSIVDSLVKPKDGHERYGTAVQTKCQTHHGHVGKVYNNRQESNQTQTEHQEPERVSKKPNGNGSSIKECLPPPTVILSCQTEVTHDDGNKLTCDTNQNSNCEKVSDKVVVLVKPDSSHQKVNLNDGTTEWQTA